MKKKYSLFDNLLYVIKGMTRWEKGLIPMQLVSIVVDCMDIFIVPVMVKLIIECLEKGKGMESVLQLTAIYGITILVVYIIRGIIDNNLQWKMNYVLIRFKRELMNAMLSMKYANLENPRVLDEHEKIRNVMNNKDAGVEGMMNSSVKVAKIILQIVVAAVLIANLSPLLIIILCVLLVVSFIPINKAKTQDKEEVWDALGPYWRKHFNLGHLTTHFQAAKEIRVYGMKDWIYGKYEQVNAGIQEKYIHSRNIWLKCHGIVKVLEFLQECFLYLFLVIRLIQGGLTVADFTLYISSVHIFSKAVNDFILEFADLKKQSSDVADFRKFIDEFSEEDTKALEEDLTYDFNFDNVTFCYQGQTKNALEDVNINIPYGQRLAVVGLNGAGKTTFIKLMCGLYKPTAGTISINGKDVSAIEEGNIFHVFSAIFQNVEEYPFSVAENVSMKPLEETDLGRVKECLKKCGLDSKIAELKFQEKTQVLKILDSDGVDFSGGEKQKLALARALYKDAPIIILDEPTAALDPLAEERLYRSFNELIGNKTGIYISHRLSSTRFCDKVAMFKDGRIVEYGTHDELMKLKGEYYTLYETQAQYYKNEAAANE